MLMSKVQQIYQPRGLGCGKEGRKEGWKEEEEEGSLKDKSVPKKRFTQTRLAQIWTGDYSLC